MFFNLRGKFFKLIFEKVFCSGWPMISIWWHIACTGSHIRTRKRHFSEIEYERSKSIMRIKSSNEQSLLTLNHFFMWSEWPPWPQLRQAFANPLTGNRHKLHFNSGWWHSLHTGARVTFIHVEHSATNSTSRYASAGTLIYFSTFERVISKFHLYSISAYARL